MRDASLHIRKSDLKDILSWMGADIDVDELMRIALDYPCNRIPVLKNTSLKKRYAVQEIFQTELIKIRKEQGDWAVRLLPTSKSQYGILSSVVEEAERFCQEFQLPRLKGFRVFIKIGLKLFGTKFRLNKFITYSEDIFVTFIENEQVNNFKNTKLLNEVFYLYCRINKLDNYQAIFDVHRVDFMKTAKQIEGVADSYDWLFAQFKAFTLLQLSIEPYHLHGEKAHQRYTKHKPKKTNYKQKQLLLRGLKL